MSAPENGFDTFSSRRDTLGDQAAFYRTLPLPQDRKCIRVLEVYNSLSPDDNSSYITASVALANMDVPPRYAALSYVWGMQAPMTKFVLCDGYAIPVTSNCYAALWHLRRKLGAFKIWVDSICINQNDEKEKKQQIPLMNAIYSRADAVYVWLGSGNDATKRAMNFMNSSGFVNHYFKNSNPDEMQLSRPRPWRAAFSVYFRRWKPKRITMPRPKTPNKGENKAGGDSLTKEDWVSYQDLEELLTRNWLRRLWTFQEIILATNPVVVCGNSSVPWSRFACSILFLDHIKQSKIRQFSLRRILRGIAVSPFIICCGSRNSLPVSDSTMDSTVQTWKNLIFSRSQLSSIDSSETNGATPQSPEKLRDYQLYLHQVFRRHQAFSMGWKMIILLGIAVYALSRVMSIMEYVMREQNACMGITSANAFQTRLFQQRCRDAVFNNNLLFIVIPIAVGVVMVVLATALLVGWIMSLVSSNRKVKSSHELAKRIDPSQDDLIEAIAYRASKNPKDKVFGMYSLLEKRIKAKLPAPDYSLPEGEIYKMLTAYLIPIVQSLNLLSMAAAARVEGQPSWVPDWHAEFDQSWEKSYLLTPLHKGVTPGSQPFTRLNLNLGTLVVRGRPICNIDKVLQLWPSESTYDNSEHATHLDNVTAMQKMPVELIDLLIGFVTNPSNKAFIPNINLKHLKSYRNIIRKRRDPFKALEELIDREDEFRAHVLFCNSIAQSKRQLFITTDLSESRRFAHSVESNKSDRMKRESGLEAGSPNTKFTTGLSSFNVQTGDRVLLIAGVSVPLIARSDKGKWRLISPAVLARAGSKAGWLDEAEKDNLEYLELC